MTDRRDIQPGPPTFMPVGTPIRSPGEIIKSIQDHQIAALKADHARAIAKLEADLAGARAEIAEWSRQYNDVADAIARESTGSDDLCNKVRAMRKERDGLRLAMSNIRAKCESVEIGVPCYPLALAIKALSPSAEGEA